MILIKYHNCVVADHYWGIGKKAQIQKIVPDNYS